VPSPPPVSQRPQAPALALAVDELPPRVGETGVEPPAEPEPVAWHEPLEEQPPATEAAQEVMDLLASIEGSLTETTYQHRTVVDAEAGRYLWDCSGMAAWILRRTAPRALAALDEERPVARDFYDQIAHSPTDRARHGWMRLDDPREIAPGDVFAWRKPDFWRDRPNTGHVGFVLSTPQPHPAFTNVWLVRIADATRVLHEDDSRPEGGGGGFGTATMAFLFDDGGGVVAYGWYGSTQDPETFIETRIAFGRVTD
jgi:hypothetical protein